MSAHRFLPGRDGGSVPMSFFGFYFWYCNPAIHSSLLQQKVNISKPATRFKSCPNYTPQGDTQARCHELWHIL